MGVDGGAHDSTTPTRTSTEHAAVQQRYQQRYETAIKAGLTSAAEPLHIGTISNEALAQAKSYISNWQKRFDDRDGHRVQACALADLILAPETSNRAQAIEWIADNIAEKWNLMQLRELAWLAGEVQPPAQAETAVRASWCQRLRDAWQRQDPKPTLFPR